MTAVRQWWDRVRGWLAVLNPLGWTVLALGVLALLLALRFGWREFLAIGVACVVLVALALPFLLGRTRVRVEVGLDPQRLVAGGTVAAGVRVTNLSSRRLVPTLLELPVGQQVRRHSLPALRSHESHEDDFTVRTERRGIIGVGPAVTRRGDPLALTSRDVPWTGMREILVRPLMVPVQSLGGGLLRDLEGVETDAISSSDLAFHALREYEPGDDLRHVHWRSSAKQMAAAGDTHLLVRQYLDTRRSHATIVVDDHAQSWREPGEFETGMSVAASVIARAVLDDFETSFVCGPQVASGSDGTRTLDAVSRAGYGRVGLVRGAREAARVADATSLLFLIGGTGTSFESLQRAAYSLPPEVSTFAVLVDPQGQSTVTDAGGLPVLRLATLDDLAAMLRWSVR